jgi:hypothetical protein
MKTKLPVVSLILAAALIAAPVSPASAHGYHHGRGDGLFYGLLGAGAALTVAAATLVTAPVRVLADASEAQPAPVYYAPAPAATYAYPAYAAGYPQQAVVYAYPQTVYVTGR